MKIQSIEDFKNYVDGKKFIAIHYREVNGDTQQDGRPELGIIKVQKYGFTYNSCDVDQQAEAKVEYLFPEYDEIIDKWQGEVMFTKTLKHNGFNRKINFYEVK